MRIGAASNRNKLQPTGYGVVSPTSGYRTEAIRPQLMPRLDRNLHSAQERKRMAESSIEWTEHTWNPVTGCTKLSPGCKHCYAETMARRLTAMGAAGYFFDE